MIHRSVRLVAAELETYQSSLSLSLFLLCIYKVFFYYTIKDKRVEVGKDEEE